MWCARCECTCRIRAHRTLSAHTHTSRDALSLSVPNMLTPAHSNTHNLPPRPNLLRRRRWRCWRRSRMPPTALRRRRERCVCGRRGASDASEDEPSPVEGYTPSIQIDMHTSPTVSSCKEDPPPSPPLSASQLPTHTHSHFTHCTHLHTHTPFLLPNIPSSHTLVPLPSPLLPFLLSTDAPTHPATHPVHRRSRS